MEKIDTNIFTKDLQSKYTVLQFCSEIYRYLVEVLFPYINKLEDNKQDKEAQDLLTTAKEIVSAINELKSNYTTCKGTIDIQRGLIQENKNAIDNVERTKQNKTDNGLKTRVKAVVGGINELKGNIDTLTSDKQDKTDNSLQTSVKTVVGGINEVNSYTKMLQPKTDNDLTTPEKTIVPAINRLYKYQDDLGDLGYFFITLKTKDNASKIYIALLTFEYVIKSDSTKNLLNSIAIPTSDNIGIIKGLLQTDSALLECLIINYHYQNWTIYTQTVQNNVVGYIPYEVNIDMFTVIDVQFETHPLSS